MVSRFWFRFRLPLPFHFWSVIDVILLYSISKPVADIVTANLSLSFNFSLESYSGRSMRLKQVLEYDDSKNEGKKKDEVNKKKDGRNFLWARRYFFGRAVRNNSSNIGKSIETIQQHKIASFSYYTIYIYCTACTTYCARG